MNGHHHQPPDGKIAGKGEHQRLQQRDELRHRKASLRNDRAHRAAFEIAAMDGNGHFARGVRCMNEAQCLPEVRETAKPARSSARMMSRAVRAGSRGFMPPE
jgi:hypothetical protein